jgi:isochorismate pyruvate lyase
MRISRTSSGTPWERQLGYARAVRAGSTIAVSGTVGADPTGAPAAPDALGQSRRIFEVIGEALQRLGSDLHHVLRLRLHYSDPSIGPGFAQALAEVYPDGAPALTGVRVAALVDPAFLLEVEADAVVAEIDRTAQPPEWDEPVD